MLKAIVIILALTGLFLWGLLLGSSRLDDEFYNIMKEADEENDEF